jgi:hypothetical protein
MIDPTSAFKQAIGNLSGRISRLQVLETALSTLAVSFTTFANLGTGLEGQVRKCTNCRKGSEGAGSGTGCLVYWDTATSSWLRVYDNAAASA